MKGAFGNEGALPLLRIIVILEPASAAKDLDLPASEQYQNRNSKRSFPSLRMTVFEGGALASGIR